MTSSSAQVGAELPFLVLKMGGSLFSDKRVAGSLRRDAVDSYARLVADLSRAAPGRVILVSGGGAIGHASIREFDPSDPFSLVGQTKAGFTVKWAWTEALRAHGVDALPLQLSAMCTSERDGFTLRGEPMFRLLAAGGMPVFSGDCLVTEQGGLFPLGSDRVPELLVGVLPGPVRVVVVTDVPGILRGRTNPSDVLRHVDAGSPEAAYQALWKQSEWDATGAMHGKLDALVNCARAGAECFITRVDSSGEHIRHLLHPVKTWPADISFTRITLEPALDQGGERLMTV